MALIDFLFIIPLDEEWQSIRPILAPNSEERTKDTVTYYFWKHLESEDNGPNFYLNVAVSMGKMGLVATGISVTRALNFWRPANAVLLGIAGSFSPTEHQLGDIVVSEEIYGYEIGSVTGRIVPQFMFRQTGHQPSAMLWDRIRAFISDKPSYSDWQNECFHSDEAKEVKLLNPQIQQPKVHRGITASGNFVVKTKSFIHQLRKQIDNRICAVEMEAKGHFEAVHSAGVDTNTIMVRGISDYADAKKSKLQKNSKDAWRRYAAANTARLMNAILNRKNIGIRSEANFQIILENRNDRLIEELISLGKENTQQFDFSLSFNSLPIPKLNIEMFGVRKNIKHIIPSRSTCIYYQNDRSNRFNFVIRDQTANFSIPRLYNAGQFAILLAFEESIDRIEFNINDEFGRSYNRIWKCNS